MAKTIELCKVDLFSTSSNLVNALPCETQMHQIVTFRSDYLYPIAHLHYQFNRGRHVIC